MEEFYQHDEEYRDTIATVDEQGKRVWVYPKKPSGQYHNYRIIVTIILLTLFFTGPFIVINGNPFLLLNFFERKFILVGQVFWPQDFFLLAILLITLFVFIILFTVSFGRIWCGWACPQTLFMEMVFRKIEYWIEGDANQQRRLNQSPNHFHKVIKKSGKHFIFLIISIIIAHTALSYLIGIEEVLGLISKSPMENLSGFIGLTVFTGIFYGVFAFFREQACIAVCPYGRLQSVLLVKDSIVVIYDWIRGEPRSKLKKNAIDQSSGDCIDCKLCVHACPTGIDIRNGTQLECVNCTACIDACDEVMEKIEKPKGLIKYGSYTAIESGQGSLLTPRTVGYSIVLLALLTFLSFMLVSRSEVDFTVLKVSGTLYEKLENDTISNLYSMKLVNRTFDELDINLKILNMETAVIDFVGSDSIILEPSGKLSGTFFIKIPQRVLKKAKTKLKIGVFKKGELIEEFKVNFLGPVTLSRLKSETIGSDGWITDKIKKNKSYHLNSYL